jgi:hypothetical protein
MVAIVAHAQGGTVGFLTAAASRHHVVGASSLRTFGRG